MPRIVQLGAEQLEHQQWAVAHRPIPVERPLRNCSNAGLTAPLSFHSASYKEPWQAAPASSRAKLVPRCSTAALRSWRSPASVYPATFCTLATKAVATCKLLSCPIIRVPRSERKSFRDNQVLNLTRALSSQQSALAAFRFAKRRLFKHVFE